MQPSSTKQSRSELLKNSKYTFPFQFIQTIGNFTAKQILIETQSLWSICICGNVVEFFPWIKTVPGFEYDGTILFLVGNAHSIHLSIEMVRRDRLTAKVSTALSLEQPFKFPVQMNSDISSTTVIKSLIFCGHSWAVNQISFTAQKYPILETSIIALFHWGLKTSLVYYTWEAPVFIKHYIRGSLFVDISINIWALQVCFVKKVTF